MMRFSKKVLFTALLLVFSGSSAMALMRYRIVHHTGSVEGAYVTKIRALFTKQLPFVGFHPVSRPDSRVDLLFVLTGSIFPGMTFAPDERFSAEIKKGAKTTIVIYVNKAQSATITAPIRLKRNRLASHNMKLPGQAYWMEIAMSPSHGDLQFYVGEEGKPPVSGETVFAEISSFLVARRFPPRPAAPAAPAAARPAAPTAPAITKEAYEEMMRKAGVRSTAPAAPAPTAAAVAEEQREAQEATRHAAEERSEAQEAKRHAADEEREAQAAERHAAEERSEAQVAKARWRAGKKKAIK